MNKVSFAGTFKGRVLEHAYGETKGNVEEGKDSLPQLIVDVALEWIWNEKDEGWQDYADNDEHAVAYLHLFNHDEGESLYHAQVMKVFGWDGTLVTDVDDMGVDDKIIQIRVEENDFNDKITLKVNWIDEEDAVPGQRIRRFSAADLKASASKFAILSKKSKGAVSKPRGKNKSTPAAPKTQGASPVDKAEKNRLRREQELKDKDVKDAAAEVAAVENGVDNGDGTTTAPLKRSMPKFGNKAEIKEEAASTMTAEEAWGKIVEAGKNNNISDGDVQGTLFEELVEATGEKEPSLKDATNAEWPAIVKSTIARFGGE
ncbi:MAG TPA: hypothetical protein ENH62_06790 [Marinobacter sp.]|uniref:Uncharacterized protein n=1 Tax=marine sediment metagenome TaxID=412755 RepID=A0A0F9TBW2_9ZZZZ|nr:hypothetical protein [Marinobacter sp.]